jgi:hypothetical protein
MNEAPAHRRYWGLKLLLVLDLAVVAALDAALAEPPRTVVLWGFQYWLACTAVLAAAALGLVGSMRQRERWPSVVTALLAVKVAVTTLLAMVAFLLAQHAPFGTALLLAEHAPSVVAAVLVLAIVALVLWMGRGQWWRTLRGGVIAGALVAGSTMAMHRMPLVDQDYEQLMADGGGEWDGFDPPSFDAEAAVYAQAPLLDASLAALRPQTPGKVDLYVLAMGGDATENVFRNEVEFVSQQFASRFGAEGRVLALVNHAETVERQPLATRTNLRRALAGIGQIMDPAEDVLLFFVTSHGSKTHELSMHMPPIALNDVTPADVASALDEADIRWRVLVVSACYSGGFVAPLKGPETLVITAARADRTSFGCGAHSDITYFGEAFFAEALNETASFTEAFASAQKAVSERERGEGFEPSRPQIAVGDAIEAKLAEWRTGVTLGPAVPFKPARDAKSGEASATPRE